MQSPVSRARLATVCRKLCIDGNAPCGTGTGSAAPARGHRIGGAPAVRAPHCRLRLLWCAAVTRDPRLPVEFCRFVTTDRAKLSTAVRYAFTADAVDVLKAEGFLSPKSGNSYTYQAVSTSGHGVINRKPFTAGEDND